MATDDVTAIKIGDGEKRVRIVHLSDTHFHHDQIYLPRLPPGDVLVHSGDFCTTGWSRLFKTPDYDHHIQQINDFFSKVPHKHKLFVGGNHDMAIAGRRQEDIQKILPEVTYLQDSGVNIEGINFYGSPWTAYKWKSYNRAFVRKWGKFEHHWDDIPTGTDVLVTHMPPHGIRDMGRQDFSLFQNRRDTCNVCSQTHEGRCHLGCPKLRHAILNRVKPKLHCFGHLHGSAGLHVIDETTFSNAALSIRVFDYYV
ncbi:UPF0046 protein C25E10.12-like [Pecten maximus]|uniref:UPF0046 protein C25E10.12-like n=1 Tax=Pecten maximus TaxID=6579 RepID=UPI001458B0D0|nr:UPF0046 protein C25E10.12-like [Pecten maximus]